MANLFLRSRPTATWSTGAKVLGDRVVSTSTTAHLGIHFEVTTAGTSSGSEPAWNTTIGGTTTDAGGVVWTTRGSANYWAATKDYVAGDRVVPTRAFATAARKSYVYECTAGGLSGGTEPAWVSTTPGTSTTADGTVIWTCRKCSNWNDSNIHLDYLTFDNSGTGAMVAGDTIYASKTHSEVVTSGNMVLTVPGTDAAPNELLCVDDTGDPALPTTMVSVPTALLSVTTTGVLRPNGFCHAHGFIFSAGSGSSSSFIQFGLGTGLDFGWSLDAFKLKLNTTSSNASIRIGRQTAEHHKNWFKARNTVIEFGHISHGIQPGDVRFEWLDTPNAVQGTIPDILFPGGLPKSGEFIISGVDLSALGAGKTIVDGGSLTAPCKFDIVNCKLGAGVVISPVATGGIGYAEINAKNCDSADTNYRLFRKSLFGSMVQETVIVITGVASDPPISWKISTLAGNNFSFPFVSFPIVFWNTAVGGAQTAKIHVLRDSLTPLTDAEVWMELEYMGTSGNPVSSRVSDRKANILATASDQPSSAESWTTTGMTNPNKQELSVNFTAQEEGPVIAWVNIAKASATIYVCPKVFVA